MCKSVLAPRYQSDVIQTKLYCYCIDRIVPGCFHIHECQFKKSFDFWVSSECLTSIEAHVCVSDEIMMTLNISHVSRPYNSCVEMLLTRII